MSKFNSLPETIQALQQQLAGARAIAFGVVKEFTDDHFPCCPSSLEAARVEVICRLWRAGYRDLNLSVKFDENEDNNLVIDVDDPRLRMLEEINISKVLKDRDLCEDEIDQTMNLRARLEVRKPGTSEENHLCNCIESQRVIKSLLDNTPYVPEGCSSGRKNDAGKPRWSLLPWREVAQVVDVLTHGAQEYGDFNWQQLDNPRQRYYDAGVRHLTSWWLGEGKDPKSGFSHLAHAVCCLLFLLWFDNEGVKK